MVLAVCGGGSGVVIGLDLLHKKAKFECVCKSRSHDRFLERGNLLPCGFDAILRTCGFNPLRFFEDSLLLDLFLTCPEYIECYTMNSVFY